MKDSGIDWKDFITKEEIQGINIQQFISIRIRKKHWTYFGHVLWMPTQMKFNAYMKLSKGSQLV